MPPQPHRSNAKPHHAAGRPWWHWLILGLVAAVSLAAIGSVGYRVIQDRLAATPGPEPARPRPLIYGGPSPSPPATQPMAPGAASDFDGAVPAASQPAAGQGQPPGNALRALLQGKAPASEQAAVDRLLANAGRREPLDHNPAGLTGPPGAERQGRFVQRGPAVVEEVAFWLVADTPVAKVAEHYRRQATARGYRPMNKTTANRSPQSKPGGGSGRWLRFTGPGPDGSDHAFLTLHLRKRAEGVHVTVWLRYAGGSANRSGRGAR